MWIVMAILSAFFAGITSILAKCGIRKTDSDVATALRTVVVLLFAWVMVFVVGSAETIGEISPRSLLFLVLSGLATGGSWICYFKALSMGDVNKVVPIDKSSTVLSVLLAVAFLGEREHIALKLASAAVIAVGIYLMIERKPDVKPENRPDAETEGSPRTERKRVWGAQNPWMVYAALSAVFAALTSVLAKVGIMGVESNLGTALRTGVVLVMAWGIVFLKGKQARLKAVPKGELGFIALSGIATGASWLCYYYAIQNGMVSVVVPIDKLSILVTMAFSFVVFKETMSKKALLGLLLMVLGTLAMALGA
ncbi:EamA family transporter [bacterium D16-50]|jgi:Predicted membrane protein|nr:EamA family transporter [bacterium D16-50]